MHGFIFAEIKKYVEHKLDRDTWYAVLEKADLGSKEYENFLKYPDEEAVAIVGTASSMTGIPVPDLLEDFGKFLGGDLFNVYRPIINPKWKTIDFLVNVEETIHDIVRSRNKQAKPPVLVANQLGPKQVRILYRSARAMSPLAIGIIRGVAAHYEEDITVTSDSSMESGTEVCEILVEVQS